MNRDELIKLLRDVSKHAYWYGEDVGDYDMEWANTQEWFMDAVTEIINMSSVDKKEVAV